eukprot:GHVU01128355.1.p1 GENE.GHVU01128355.1~~GHVU01128355.1.p1  ORF type:complete len:352 (+),score=40.25 GHVU01128355.1:629-1684(+)
MKHEEFEYEEELGRGGTGVVWRARHRPTNKEYAVKEYFGDVARRQQRSNPISRELAALRGLAGVPGVCRFVRYFEEQPVFASLVMELVPGDPLHIVFRRHLHDSSTPPVNIPPPSVRLPGLPVSTVQRYTANLFGSLDAIHRAGFLYGDLKAANVIVHPEEATQRQRPREPHPSREVPVDTPDRTLQDRGGEGAATTLTIVDFGSTVKFEDNAEGREDHREGWWWQLCGAPSARRLKPVCRRKPAQDRAPVATRSRPRARPCVLVHLLPPSLPPYAGGVRGGAGSIPVDEFTCTPHNTPPEAAHPSGSRMGPAADWWQLGVLTYEMIFGAPPFGYRDGDIDGMCGCVTSSA